MVIDFCYLMLAFEYLPARINNAKYCKTNQPELKILLQVEHSHLKAASGVVKIALNLLFVLVFIVAR